jgi:hypothetical protein
VDSGWQPSFLMYKCQAEGHQGLQRQSSGTTALVAAALFKLVFQFLYELFDSNQGVPLHSPAHNLSCSGNTTTGVSGTKSQESLSSATTKNCSNTAATHTVVHAAPKSVSVAPLHQHSVVATEAESSDLRC